MKETITCEGCGADVDVDLTLGVTKMREPASTSAPGRVTIHEGGMAIHQCAEGTYSAPES